MCADRLQRPQPCAGYSEPAWLSVGAAVIALLSIRPPTVDRAMFIEHEFTVLIWLEPVVVAKPMGMAEPVGVATALLW